MHQTGASLYEKIGTNFCKTLFKNEDWTVFAMLKDFTGSLKKATVLLWISRVTGPNRDLLTDIISRQF
jgi:hypothetical protein